MNFVKVITDENKAQYINMNYVYSFEYDEKSDQTTIDTPDQIVHVKGNVVQELKKYILGDNGSVGTVAAP